MDTSGKSAPKTRCAREKDRVKMSSTVGERLNRIGGGPRRIAWMYERGPERGNGGRNFSQATTMR